MLHSGWLAATVHRQQPDGMLAPFEIYPVPYTSWFTARGLDVADVNGDSLPDILAAGEGFGLAVLYHVPFTPPLPPIDIKPDSADNVIGLKKNGAIQVAILSSETFDAPVEVDRYSLTFGHTGKEPSRRSHKDGWPVCETWDANTDGRIDLVCQFWGSLTNFQSGDTEGILKGMTLAGRPFEARDMIRIVPQ